MTTTLLNGALSPCAMICTVFNSVSSSIQKQQCKNDMLNRRLIVVNFGFLKRKHVLYLQYSMWPHDADLQRTVHLCMSVLTIILIRTPFLPCVVLETEDTLYKFYQQLQVASAMYVGLLLSVLSSCSKESKGKLCLLCMYFPFRGHLFLCIGSTLCGFARGIKFQKLCQSLFIRNITFQWICSLFFFS